MARYFCHRSTHIIPEQLSYCKVGLIDLSHYELVRRNELIIELLSMLSYLHLQVHNRHSTLDRHLVLEDLFTSLVRQVEVGTGKLLGNG